MSNKTKIALTIIIILIIILGIYAATRGIKKENVIENKENVFDMDSYLDEIDNSAKEEQSDENNEIKNEQIRNEINTDKTDEKNENDSKNQIIGKEEQESKNEENKIVVDREEKAKQLAKEEWGIDVDSYNYNIIQKIDNDNYQVEVRSKTTTTQIVIYNVNVVTEEVTEQ